MIDYVDQGISGAKDRRPALDRLLAAARRRQFDVLLVWRLDRLGRNLRHLVTLRTFTCTAQRSTSAYASAMVAQVKTSVARVRSLAPG